MPKFAVTRKEVHISYSQIEAETAEEAISRVQDGDGEEVLVEYSHTIDGSYEAKLSEV